MQGTFKISWILVEIGLTKWDTSPKKQPVFKPELIQKISAAVYFIPVRVLFCKNFVGKVQSKCENAQKEPRKQICQQQTGYPRTLKTYIMASYYCFLRLFSAKIALDFQSVMDEIFPHWCFIEQKWNTSGRHIIFSFCYTRMYFFLSISLLVLFTSSHFIYVCQKMKVFHEKKIGQKMFWRKGGETI